VAVRLTIGVDVGGTKVAAGVVDSDGRIIEKLKRSTPAASPARTAEVIADVVTELASRHDVGAVGLGAAGFVDQTRSAILFAPNLAWRNEPLLRSVQDLVGLPVLLENDANASVWAEARFGAARGYRDVLFVAIGTGIGAALIIGGDLYRGRWGMGGEPGHYRVVPDGRLCGCGNRGCWEQYASGNALVAEARDLARRSPEGARRLLQLGGGTPEGISGPQVTEAAREGDPAALRCFQIVGSWLGQGLADLAAILDPGCFVIGGGVSEAGDMLVEPARAAYEKALPGRGYRPLADVRIAELGTDAGVVGAADLARRHVEARSAAEAGPVQASTVQASPVQASAADAQPA
jgi:glucokinase